MSRAQITSAKRIVIKIGSSSLTGKAGAALDVQAVNKLVDVVAACRARGAEVVVVSSGAIAAGVIDELMIDKFHQGRVETTGFDVADATLDGNLSGALIALRSALETGTDPVMITSAIASALRSLAKVSGANRGVKSFELAGQLGMAPWQIDKARRQLNRWSPAQIADAVGAIALADAEVKGAASDPIYALEKALTRIAMAQRA